MDITTVGSRIINGQTNRVRVTTVTMETEAVTVGEDHQVVTIGKTRIRQISVAVTKVVTNVDIGDPVLVLYCFSRHSRY